MTSHLSIYSLLKQIAEDLAHCQEFRQVRKIQADLRPAEAN